MSWVKLLGVCCLIGSGIWAAYRVNREASTALAELEAWQKLLRYVKAQIDCFSLPIGRILEGVDSSLLAACGYTAEKTPNDFLEMFSYCGIRDTQGRKILFEFCEGAGKRYREEESRSCDYFIALLSERIGQLRAQLPNRKRLCSTLCVSATVAVVILLI